MNATAAAGLAGAVADGFASIRESLLASITLAVVDSISPTLAALVGVGVGALVTILAVLLLATRTRLLDDVPFVGVTPVDPKTVRQLYLQTNAKAHASGEAVGSSRDKTRRLLNLAQDDKLTVGSDEPESAWVAVESDLDQLYAEMTSESADGTPPEERTERMRSAYERATESSTGKDGSDSTTDEESAGALATLVRDLHGDRSSDEGALHGDGGAAHGRGEGGAESYSGDLLSSLVAVSKSDGGTEEAKASMTDALDRLDEYEAVVDAIDDATADAIEGSASVDWSQLSGEVDSTQLLGARVERLARAGERAAYCAASDAAAEIREDRAVRGGTTESELLAQLAHGEAVSDIRPALGDAVADLERLGPIDEQLKRDTRPDLEVRGETLLERAQDANLMLTDAVASRVHELLEDLKTIPDDSRYKRAIISRQFDLLDELVDDLRTQGEYSGEMESLLNRFDEYDRRLSDEFGNQQHAVSSSGNTLADEFRKLANEFREDALTADQRGETVEAAALLTAANRLLERTLDLYHKQHLRSLLERV